MLSVILKRLLQAIPVLLAVITITFVMVRAAPGGPFDEERQAPPEILKNLEQKYNLDAPLWKQYVTYLGGLAHGDLGPSFKYPNRTVNDMIAAGFPVTAELAFYALLIAIVLGLFSGVFAALKQNTWQDYLPMSVAMLGICFPSLVMGPLLLLLFGVQLEWLPVSGWGSLPGDKILPAITLGTTYAAYVARISRGGMLEELSKDYVRTARAKGLSEWRVVTVHALRGGVSPVVAFLGPAIAGLLTGSFVVESIFQIPGLGRFYVQAAFNRDYTMVLGTTIFFSILIIALNLLADMIMIWLNPRLRQQKSGRTANG